VHEVQDKRRARVLKRLAASLAGLILLAVFIAGSINAVAKSRYADFNWYYYAGDYVLSAKNIYHYVLDGYMYPPFFAVFMIPLSAIPRTWAAAVWYAGNLFSLLVLFATCGYLVEGSAGGVWSWVKGKWRAFRAGEWDLVVVATFAITAGFWALNLQLGQINIYLWALTMLAVYCDARDRPARAGILMGVVCTIKFSPALLLVYFIFRKRFSVVAYAALTMVVLFAVPAVVTGWHRNAELLVSWYQRVVRPALKENFIYGVEANQSLGAFIFSYCKSFGWCDPAREVGVKAVKPFINAVTLGAFAIIFLLQYVRRRAVKLFRPVPGPSLADNLNLSLIIMCSVMLSPFAWDAHYVAAVMPFMTSVYAVKHMRRGGFKTVCMVLLVLSAFCGIITNNAWGPEVAAWTYHLKGVALSGTFLCLALVLMLAKYAVVEGPGGRGGVPRR